MVCILYTGVYRRRPYTPASETDVSSTVCSMTRMTSLLIGPCAPTLHWTVLSSSMLSWGSLGEL